jgi:hypothetical protein
LRRSCPSSFREYAGPPLPRLLPHHSYHARTPPVVPRPRSSYSHGPRTSSGIATLPALLLDTAEFREDFLRRQCWSSLVVPAGGLAGLQLLLRPLKMSSINYSAGPRIPHSSPRGGSYTKPGLIIAVPFPSSQFPAPPGMIPARALAPHRRLGDPPHLKPCR